MESPLPLDEFQSLASDDSSVAALFDPADQSGLLLLWLKLDTLLSLETLAPDFQGFGC
jgi:hypothetical protein